MKTKILLLSTLLAAGLNASAQVLVSVGKEPVKSE